MPTATLRDVSVDPVLTSISVMHVQDAKGYVHHRLFPVVPVTQEDGFYFVFDRGDSLRPDAQRRAPGAAFARKAQGISTRPIALEQWGLEYKLPDEMRSSTGSPLQDESAVVGVVTQDLLLRREIEFFTAYVAEGSATPWGNADFAGVTSGPSGRQFLRWDQSGATPILDIKRWIRDVQVACGMKPNKLMLNPTAFDLATEAANVLSRLPDDAPRDVSAANLAALAGLDEVLVPEAVYNTAAEGAAYSGRFALQTSGLLLFTTPSPARVSPSAGYVFSWSEFDSVRAEVSSAGAAAIETYRDEPTKSDVFRGSAHFDMGIATPSAGVRLTALNV